MKPKVRETLRKNRTKAKRRVKREAKATAPALGPEALLERFGRYIYMRRTQARLSLRQFAKVCRIPFSNVFQYERLGKNPRLTELHMMARGLGEPTVDFLKPLFGTKKFPALGDTRQLERREMFPPSPEAEPLSTPVSIV
jgi:transcriptional regulator with XRE-family HTH domain